MSDKVLGYRIVSLSKKGDRPFPVRSITKGFVIGTDGTCQIRLKDVKDAGFVPVHCQVTPIENKMYLVPNVNGRTLVNGHELKGSVELKNGDMITVGKGVQISFRYETALHNSAAATPFKDITQQVVPETPIKMEKADDAQLGHSSSSLYETTNGSQDRSQQNDEDSAEDKENNPSSVVIASRPVAEVSSRPEREEARSDVVSKPLSRKLTYSDNMVPPTQTEVVNKDTKTAKSSSSSLVVDSELKNYESEPEPEQVQEVSLSSALNEVSAPTKTAKTPKKNAKAKKTEEKEESEAESKAEDEEVPAKSAKKAKKSVKTPKKNAKKAQESAVEESEVSEAESKVEDESEKKPAKKNARTPKKTSKKAQAEEKVEESEASEVESKAEEEPETKPAKNAKKNARTPKKSAKKAAEKVEESEASEAESKAEEEPEEKPAKAKKGSKTPKKSAKSQKKTEEVAVEESEASEVETVEEPKEKSSKKAAVKTPKKNSKAKKTEEKTEEKSAEEESTEAVQPEAKKSAKSSKKSKAKKVEEKSEAESQAEEHERPVPAVKTSKKDAGKHYAASATYESPRSPNKSPRKLEISPDKKFHKITNINGAVKHQLYGRWAVPDLDLNNPTSSPERKATNFLAQKVMSKTASKSTKKSAKKTPLAKRQASAPSSPTKTVPKPHAKTPKAKASKAQGPAARPVEHFDAPDQRTRMEILSMSVVNMIKEALALMDAWVTFEELLAYHRAHYAVLNTDAFRDAVRELVEQKVISVVKSKPKKYTLGDRPVPVEEKEKKVKVKIPKQEEEVEELPEFETDGEESEEEQDLQTDLQRDMMAVWLRVKGAKSAKFSYPVGPFMHRPNKEKYPDYYTSVSRVVTMKQILQKIKCGDYQTMEEMYKDFRQMFINCKRFNRVHTDIHSCGLLLETQFKLAVKHFKEAAKHSQEKDGSDEQEESEERENGSDEEEQAGSNNEERSEEEEREENSENEEEDEEKVKESVDSDDE